MKRLLKFFLNIFDTLFFNPLDIIRKWRGLPFFIKNFYAYSKKSHPQFKIKLITLLPILRDRFESAGDASGQYFFQDLWASNLVYNNEIKEIIDIGSRLDGYIAHILPFCKVTYIDIREMNNFHQNFTFKSGSILNLPFPDESVNTISCLHVIEHIGLGRYGDPVNPKGHEDAAKEICRVLKPGGTLILGTPLGKERLCFDAHRIFDPSTIEKMFNTLKIEKLDLIPDKGDKIIENIDFETARNNHFACGLFILKKI